MSSVDASLTPRSAPRVVSAHQVSVDSLEPGLTTREMISARARSRWRPAGPSSAGSPSLAAMACTAATWPCGSDPVMVTAPAAGLLVHVPGLTHSDYVDFPAFSHHSRILQRACAVALLRHADILTTLCDRIRPKRQLKGQHLRRATATSDRGEDPPCAIAGSWPRGAQRAGPGAEAVAAVHGPERAGGKVDHVAYGSLLHHQDHRT